MVNARTSSDAGARVVARDSRGAAAGPRSTRRTSRGPADVDALVAATVAAFGRLDILVNNASVRRERAFAELGFDEWREILGVTLDGAYLCSRAALPHLVASGRGAIVNIGGLSAHTGSAGRAHVVAAKAGLVGLTRALAHDLAPHQITVNCVVARPDRHDARERGGQAPAHHAIACAACRTARDSPRRLRALVRFLCGPEARYITGQTIHANGGAYLGS